MSVRRKAKRSVLATILSNVASTVAGWFGQGYTATDPRRKLMDPRHFFGVNRATANQILSQNLPLLRAYCRDLERNNATARAGAEALCALIVGTGVSLQPDTGDERTDQLIRDEWEKFIQACDVDGRDLYTIQTEACREMVVTGEAVWRIVVDPDLMTPSGVPARVVCLESEWLVDEIPEPTEGAASAVAGIRLDRFGRPVQYRLCNPAGGNLEDVDADRIIHVFERRRSMQARGETWFAPIIETLMNERDLVDVELYSAKQCAAMALVITAENHDDPDTEQDGTPTDPATTLRVGGVARMNPGEKVEAFSHTRPSQQIAPFRQMLRGDIAAALRIPQRFLDRDVSRANYSSMRADMLDTDRLLAPVREWFGHQTAGTLYKRVLPFLALRAGIKVPRANYRLLPDGQPYIDPQKDADAAIAAINGGISTYEHEIGKRGGDYRQVWEQRKREQDEAAALGLKLSSDSSNQPPPVPQSPQPTPKSEEKPEKTAEDAERIARAMTRAEREENAAAIGKAIKENIPPVNVRIEQALAPAPSFVVNVPQQAPPVVNVPQQAAPVVNVAPASVSIEQAAQVAPSVVVNVPQQAAPTVNVAPAAVTIENEVIVPARTVKATPQRDGSVLMTPQEE